MQIADVQDRETVELSGEAFREHLIGANPDLGGIGVPAPVCPRQAEDRRDERVRYRQVLDVEEGQSPSEGTRFMVLLDAKPLTGVDLAQTNFQRMCDLVGTEEVCWIHTWLSTGRGQPAPRLPDIA